MNLLIIGQSAREHAIAWKLAQSAHVDTLFVAPGNAGTAMEPKVRNIATTDPRELLAFAQQHAIDFTIVGPCAPLQNGIVDLFEQHGQKIYGPTKDASKLEWSKVFAKDFMRRHGIPAAASVAFTDAPSAKAFVRTQALPIVIKADGLVKGFEMTVAIAATVEEADAAIDELFAGRGGQVLVEQFLEGDEVSFTVMCDGSTFIPLATSKDHKRLLDNDLGPNTGGMGAFSPSPNVSEATAAAIFRDIVEPTLRGMASEKTPYRGFLYVGVMIDRSGRPHVLEFNARLGDPEALTLLSRLDTDLAELFDAAIRGELHRVNVDWNPRACVTICVATPEYPAQKIAHPIPDWASAAPDSCKLFYGSAIVQNDSLVATGGRAFCVTASGETVKLAAESAYRFLGSQTPGSFHYRTDIGMA